MVPPMAGFFEKTIGPVAFETSAKSARRAFELGCSAVIIDGTLPDTVAAEIAAAQNSGDSIYGDAHKGLCLEAAGDGKDVLWQDGFLPGLHETGRWMIEQARQAVAEGLRPPPAYTAEEILMTLYQNLKIFAGWHVDGDGAASFPDVHFHICGAGIQIADPLAPSVVRIDHNEKSLVSHFEAVVNGGMDFDRELLERGFQLRTLKPGQKLVFSKDCLHRSAATQDGQMKLRAVMF